MQSLHKLKPLVIPISSWSPPPIMGDTSHSSTMAPAIVLLLITVLLAAPRRHGATEYTVGDSAGWTIGPNYLAWSQKYNFTAGDTLVFNYVVGQHNVYRVTQDALRSCDPANGTMGIWATGSDLVNLTVPGDYYFLCNITGHCLGGMKFSVAVAAPPPPPPTPPTLPPPPPPPPIPSTGVSWIVRRPPAWPEAGRVACLAVIGLLVHLV
ncbi:hypothetical protein U9M48_015035 [Paspalum notatum var. saurae]|uniref:Phytocyanin domain-containing protein n=1 Tax=Paspalum notatum var. saurae TaxID=547442 RepID=A0AAQ3T2X2_PASNO